MDNISPVERSDLMRKVKSKGNLSTEITVIRIFRELKITGWRRNYPVIGKPDFVFVKKKIAVFVDGCFWHGCPLHCRIPSSNTDYWNCKIEKNKKRDQNITQIFENRGWIVIRIWEHDLKKKNLNHTIFNQIKLLTD